MKCHLCTRIGPCALETGGAELPTGHFIEWLAEWGREVRRKQTGLMLLTAHRAKGLEFDHVVVLDGAWDKIGSSEDRDTPRRLFYVAMTRARKTLTQARMDMRHPLLDALPDGEYLIRRSPTELPQPSSSLNRRYRRFMLSEVDLGFSGRFAPSKPVHDAIAKLTTGDELTLREINGRWGLIDGRGNLVGRLSKAFKAPAKMTLVSARIMAIVVWQKKFVAPQFQPSVACERWEVVIPELVFSPSR